MAIYMFRKSITRLNKAHFLSPKLLIFRQIASQFHPICVCKLWTSYFISIDTRVTSDVPKESISFIKTPSVSDNFVRSGIVTKKRSCDSVTIWHFWIVGMIFADARVISFNGGAPREVSEAPLYSFMNVINLISVPMKAWGKLTQKWESIRNKMDIKLVYTCTWPRKKSFKCLEN